MRSSINNMKRCMWLCVFLPWATWAQDAGMGLPFCPSPAAVQKLEEGRSIQRESGEDGADAAIAFYKEALALDSSCVLAEWEMAFSFQKKGDWASALAALENVKKKAPEFPELENQLATATERVRQSSTLSALPPLGKLKPRDEKPKKGEGLTLAAVGDICMGLGWPEDKAQLPPNEGRGLFQGVAQSLQSADVTFGNLETVLADAGDSTKCGKRSTKCYAFRVPTAYSVALKEAGFDVLSVANNHAGDFGPEGRRSTIAALDSVGIVHSGPIGDIARFEVKGKKVAMVAFSYGADVYRMQEIELGQRVVAELKRYHDIVMVSFHAGAEGKGAERTPKGVEKFLGENRGDSRRFARSMVDAGADVLLGHGPHVLRGMEIYRGRLILYSMGNFSAWTNFSLTGTKGVTAVFQMTLAPNGVLTQLKVEPIAIVEQGLPVPDAQKRAITYLRELSEQDFGQALIDENGEWGTAETFSER